MDNANMETVEIKCRRCGGQGAREEWRNTGSTCFDCGGAGTEVVTREVYAQVQMDAERMALLDVQQLVYSAADWNDVERTAAQIARELHALRMAGTVSRAAAVDFIRRVERMDLSGTHGPSKARFGRTMAKAIVAAGRK